MNIGSALNHAYASSRFSGDGIVMHALADEVDRLSKLADRNWQIVVNLQNFISEATTLLEAWMGYGANDDNRRDTEALLTRLADAGEIAR